MSVCRSNCKGLGMIIDHYLRPVDNLATSFIMDTPYLLRKIGPQPIGTRLFSLDVQSMYPSIPTSRGPDMVRKRCMKTGMRAELVEWLVSGQGSETPPQK